MLVHLLCLTVKKKGASRIVATTADFFCSVTGLEVGADSEVTCMTSIKLTKGVNYVVQ